MHSSQLLLSPRRITRKIPKTPFKVLDAPELQDDFYLNLLDWSPLNLLAVGLGSAVYLWNACTCQVSRLCDLQEEGDSLTSVCWSERGQTLGLGTQAGHVQIWDTHTEKKLYDLRGHHARVGTSTQLLSAYKYNNYYYSEVYLLFAAKRSVSLYTYIHTDTMCT